MANEVHQIIPYGPFSKGVDLATTPSYLPEGFVTRAKNVEFSRGLIRKRYGYARRSYTSSGAPATSTVLPLATSIIGSAMFWPAGGTATECLFTTTHAYSYNYGTGAVASLFTDTSGSPATADACFSGNGSSLSWTIAPVTKGGAQITPVIVFTDGYVKSSGVMSIYQFTGTAGSLADSRLSFSEITSISFAKQVMWFGEHLMIGDYDSGGTRIRNGVAWGDFQVLGISSSNNDMAEYVISDAKGYLQRMIRLGGHLAIYFSDSIVICDPTTTDDIYLFDTRVTGIGLLGPQAVVDIGGYHFMVGNDNVYLYDGGLNPKQIGDRVKDRLFGSLDPETVSQVIAHHIPYKNSVNLYLPNKDLYVYNYKDDTWSGPGLTAHQITAAGTGLRTAAYHCNDEPYASSHCGIVFVGNIAQNDAPYGNMPCSAFSIKKNFPLPVLGESGGDYFDLSDIHTTDGGTVIDAEVITDSKSIGEVYSTWGRVMEARVESTGSVVDLYYSTDHGTTWIKAVEDLGGHTNFAIDIVPLSIASDFLMWKFVFRGGGVDLRNLTVRARPSSKRGLS